MDLRDGDLVYLKQIPGIMRLLGDDGYILAEIVNLDPLVIRPFDRRRAVIDPDVIGTDLCGTYHINYEDIISVAAASGNMVEEEMWFE